jgi:hypothetical protein
MPVILGLSFACILGLFCLYIKLFLTLVRASVSQWGDGVELTKLYPYNVNVRAGLVWDVIKHR